MVRLLLFLLITLCIMTPAQVDTMLVKTRYEVEQQSMDTIKTGYEYYENGKVYSINNYIGNDILDKSTIYLNNGYLYGIYERGQFNNYHDSIIFNWHPLDSAIVTLKRYEGPRVDATKKSIKFYNYQRHVEDLFFICDSMVVYDSVNTVEERYRFTLDANGNFTSIRYTDEKSNFNFELLNIENEYDNLNRLISQKHQDGTSENFVTIEYNDKNEILRSRNGRLENGVETELTTYNYFYDYIPVQLMKVRGLIKIQKSAQTNSGLYKVNGKKVPKKFKNQVLIPLK